LTYIKSWINGFVGVGLSASEEVIADSEHVLTGRTQSDDYFAKGYEHQ
jgi:hypothetical protein